MTWLLLRQSYDSQIPPPIPTPPTQVAPNAPNAPNVGGGNPGPTPDPDQGLEGDA